MATKKSPTTKKASASKKGSAKLGKVMGEYKRGQLKSGGKKKVSSPKQAIAIALSEARESGAKIPKKGAAAKKGAAKKAAPKKAAPKKAASKKGAAKKKSAAKKK